MSNSRSRTSPIGVFDSGIGGLTVLKEIMQRLSSENLIYLGDTARVPYGTKSRRTVIKYSQSNARFLIPKGVKLIVVACNTASSFAIASLRESCDIPIVGVIEPGARKAVGVTKSGRIGVIGTPSTIKSSAYTKAVKKLAPDAQIVTKACPLFVPLADEGLNESEIARLAANIYLDTLKKQDIDTLILGCTHYPLLKPVIQEVMGAGVTLVDSAEETAAEIEALLKENALNNESEDEPYREYYLTDVSESFVEVAERFLGSRIEKIEQVDIGGTPEPD